MYTFFCRIPFTSLEAFAEWPSATRGRSTFDHLREHRTQHLWAGRLAVTISRAD